MSLINNPYCQTDAQEYQEENNYLTEQEMIYDLVDAYAHAHGEINIDDIVENQETVSHDEVEEAVRKWRMIHDWA